MALTTLFGTVQLELQNALAAGLRMEAGSPTVPNFAVVSLRRDSFHSQHEGGSEKALEQFRRDLHEAVGSYMTANGWRAGGTGHLVINLLLRAIPRDCTVQVRRADALYKLRIKDDSGLRSVGVKGREAKIGREHEPPPRDFIAVADSSRMLSREHIVLHYRDLALTAQVLGRNPTSLNEAPVGTDPFPLHRGDRLRCGTIVVEVEEL